MKATIEVKDRKEADNIRAGLEDPAVRAFVTIVGVLSTLPNTRAQARVMTYVRDLFDEQQDNSE